MLLELEHFRAADLAHADPLGEQQGHNNQHHALGHENGQHGHDDQPGDGVADLHDALHDVVRHAAEEAGDQAIAHADDHIDDDGDKGDDEGDAGPLPGAGPQVPAHVVGTEQEGVLREQRGVVAAALDDAGDLRPDAPGHNLLALLAGDGHDAVVIIGVHHGPKGGEEHDEQDDDQPHHSPPVAEEADGDALPVALGGEVLVGGDIPVGEELEILLDGHVWRVVHAQPSFVETRMRGSSRP